MAFNIERGVIRKVYRAKMKGHGWIAIPIIDLLCGDTVTPPAVHEDWPLAYMSEFVGEQVEVIFSSKGKYGLLPFHNQHYLLFSNLARCTSGPDPMTFQELPHIKELLDGKSGMLRDCLEPVLAVKKALDEVFDPDEQD